MPRSSSLSLAMPSASSPVSSAITTPTVSETASASPQSSKYGEFRFDDKENHSNKVVNDGAGPRIVEPHLVTEVPLSPNLTSLPPFPSSPQSAPKHMRDPSRSFFSNLKASKSSNRVHHVEPTIRQVPLENPRDAEEPAPKPFYTVSKGSGSTPDLSKSSFGTDSQDADGSSIQAPATQRRPAGTSIMSDSAIATSHTEYLGRKNKPRFGHLLGRTRSIRTDDSGRRSKPTTPIRITGPEELRHFDGSNDPGGLKTAPLQHEKDRSFRDMMGSAIRNKSADRQHGLSLDQRSTSTDHIDKESVQGLTISSSSSSSYRDGHGARAHLISNIKNTSTKAADGLGKAGKGILGKISRTSTNNNIKDGLDDEPYICSVINLPLVEQTRRTRIAKRLVDSKDKTEFWMPALPWRCIDYLNFKGCEEEGLYRIPGSGPKIREWQRRFDQEGDIDLFNETSLYDINIIGSMFKAWLRDLPTEILPKVTQAKIAHECAGAKEVPKLLKDELSKLPPWNYYLLFAITCHLSLLHAYVDKNKMNYSNLCICFQPCLNIDAFCFQFLVCDWRNCWQGCWTEKEALQEEYSILDAMLSSSGDSSEMLASVAEEYSPSTSQSSRINTTGRTQDRGRPPPLSLTISTDPFTTQHQRPQSEHIGSSSRLPKLAPVMPLSPIGL